MNLSQLILDVARMYAVEAVRKGVVLSSLIDAAVPLTILGISQGSVAFFTTRAKKSSSDPLLVQATPDKLDFQCR